MLAGVAPGDRVRALADALSADGYAASASAAPAPAPAPTPAPAGAAAGETAMAGEAAAALAGGEQLCQHHCPVAHVAEEFPQLCEAETEAFSRLLGRPVQRLATIAHGDGICTTHVTGHSLVGEPPAEDSARGKGPARAYDDDIHPESGGLLT